MIVKCKLIELSHYVGAGGSEDRTSLLVDDILNELSSLNYSNHEAGVMALLFKMDCLGIIHLKEVVRSKLESLLINGLASKEIYVNDVVSQLYILNMGESNLELGEAGGSKLANIILVCLDNSQRQNFDYYMRMMELGSSIKSKEVVEKSLSRFPTLPVYPHNIKRIIHAWRYHRTIAPLGVCKWILEETWRHFEHLRPLIHEILFTSTFCSFPTSTLERHLVEKILNRERK